MFDGEEEATGHTFMFVLVLPDGSKENATVTVKQPALFSALLGKGQCARGWLPAA